MHELAVAEGILAVVLQAAEGEEVKRIRLQVGQLQHLTQDSLQFSFRLLAEGSPAAEAEIEVENIPAIFTCRSCGASNELKNPPYQCAACGGMEMQVLSGEEIVVDSVDLANGTTIRRRVEPVSEALEKHIKEEHGHGSEGH